MTSDANPNGSRNNIAGVYNETGTVLGLMPHPERLADRGAVGHRRRQDVRLARGGASVSGAARAACHAQGISDALVAEHGLSPDEYKLLLEGLGREPSLTELGIFSVMWSEHCSYKSSKVWLKKLPTSGPQVIQGPGENAGVVDLGDGQAAVFKMESHNHPSYIEPYQGAATGVGGIMRDVFTMGARPIANMNALRFGAPDHPKTRHLVAGVVSGIGDYGNCMGVPTVGGETNFDPRYNDNILVNAMCVGLVDANRIFKSAAKGVGLPVVYVGSKTGRDGIHGATMASAEFDEASEEKRPTVQVGDPVHREAPARSLSRADGRGRDRRHPGHGRGGPHLLLGRDGRQGRGRHRARARPRADPRGRHDRLRDDAVGKPGAHAHGAEARPARRPPSACSGNGASTSR